ncbi:hypothetical protein ALC60_08234 [Trachymyrmex zeteki]|uniref:Uncharacterized protein n=1 Tax=Mycetomoellerius zeteki TaxID=64791 RepID=A0A151WXS5_9HYME|nr:hypothetical protein ALC60_08234 [Trachymyrmex zeteki]
MRACRSARVGGQFVIAGICRRLDGSHEFMRTASKPDGNLRFRALRVNLQLEVLLASERCLPRSPSFVLRASSATRRLFLSRKAEWRQRREKERNERRQRREREKRASASIDRIGDSERRGTF